MNHSAPQAPVAHDAQSGLNFSQLAIALVESVSYYASVRLDSARLQWKSRLISLVPLFFAVIVAVGLVGTSSVLLVLSVATAIAWFFDAGWWVGGLTTALLFLGGGGFALWFVLKRARARELFHLLKKYENRRNQQRRRFGCDLVQVHNG